MDHGNWWILKIGSRGRGSPLIEDKYLLTYDASFLLNLWIWWLCLLLVLPSYVFEYIDVSSLLDEMWWVNPSWGSFWDADVEIDEEVDDEKVKKYVNWPMSKE